MRNRLLSLLLVLILFSCTSKNKTENLHEGFNVSEADQKELGNAEKKMFDEIIKYGDYWKTDISDDYITINADGIMANKAESLADSSRKKMFSVVTATKLSDRKVRKYGNTAIITGKAQFMMGDKMAAEVFYTEIWLKKEGKWLFDGWQGTLTKEMQQAMMKQQ
jgi:hypothetical protein